MTVIERAARSIWEISGKPYHAQDIVAGMQAPDALPDWERFVPVARAVIDAIREPSAMAIGWGADAVKDMAEENERATAQAVWKAIIAGTLQEAE